MHRITISLPADLAATIAEEAERRGTSVSEVVRGAISRMLGAGDEPPDLPIAALGRSGKKTTARDAEDILAREWNGAGRR
jgi:Arc/MetJ-type ribon-helix-helix transcriptional regulator